MRRLVRCGTTLVDSILGGAALQRCGKTYPPPRTGRAQLQEPALSGAEGCHPEPIKKRASAPAGHGRYPGSHLKRIVIPNEVRDLQFAVEENHASSGTLRINSISHSILGGAALHREKTYPSLHEREGTPLWAT
jgi:hypothetical protein